MADAESLKDEEFLAKFSISFSWDYPDDWSLTDVQSAIFHVVDDRDTRLEKFLEYEKSSPCPCLICILGLAY